MSQLDLFVKGSPAHCRVGEGPYYAIDTTEWGGSPTSPSVVAYDINNAMAVTTSVITGTPTIEGDLVKLPKFSSSVAGKFRLVVSFTNDQYAPAKPALDVWVSD